MKNRIHIVVTGSNKLTGKGIARLLSQMGYFVSHLTNPGLPSLRRETSEPPHLIFITTTPADRNESGTVLVLKTIYPGVPVVIITLDAGINDIIRGIKAGVHGYLMTSIEPKELKAAVTAITTNNDYFFDLSGERLMYSEKNDIKDPVRLMAAQHLPEPEKKVLALFCSELSHEEIALKLQYAPRTLAAYKENICGALHFKSRVGLALFALKNNLFGQDTFS